MCLRIRSSLLCINRLLTLLTKLGHRLLMSRLLRVNDLLMLRTQKRHRLCVRHLLRGEHMLMLTIQIAEDLVVAGDHQLELLQLLGEAVRAVGIAATAATVPGRLAGAAIAGRLARIAGVDGAL